MGANLLLAIRRSRREFLLISAGLLAAACSGGSRASTATAPTQAPSRSTAVEPTRAATAGAPTPAATAPPASLEVRGSEEFKAWTLQALNLLKTKAAPEYAEVMKSILIIESVTAGSGIVVQEKRFKVGEITAYAPGFPPAQQLIWYAGAIVHDATHSALFTAGRPHSGKDAEVECLKVQKAALLKIEANSYFSNYVQGLIDGADDPANQCWNQPNRHW